MILSHFWIYDSVSFETLKVKKYPKLGKNHLAIERFFYIYESPSGQKSDSMESIFQTRSSERVGIRHVNLIIKTS